jgi:YfiH family protein
VTISLIKSRILDEAPGVTAGFTTREGGVSAGALASLNLGMHVGDARQNVHANRDAVLAALGRADATWVSLRQVHSNGVVEVTRLAGRSIEADGVWTRDRMAAISVLVADCVPILIAEESGRAVCAVHAGWRGTRSRVAAEAVARLSKAGFPPNSLRVAVGPAIGPCCFEIGDEVADELGFVSGDVAGAMERNAGGRVTADLWAINRALLVSAGVEDSKIDVFRLCTSCNPDFYSHRRDKGATGRQAGIIALA